MLGVVVVLFCFNLDVIICSCMLECIDVFVFGFGIFVVIFNVIVNYCLLCWVVLFLVDWFNMFD